MTLRFPSTHAAPRLLNFVALTLLALPAATAPLRAEDHPSATPAPTEIPGVTPASTAHPPPPDTPPAAVVAASVVAPVEAATPESKPESAAPVAPLPHPEARPEVSAHADHPVAEIKPPAVAAAEIHLPPAGPPATKVPDSGPVAAKPAEPTPVESAHGEAKAHAAPSPAVAHAPEAAPAASAIPTPRPKRVAALPGVTAKEAQGLVNLGGSLTERGDFDAAEIAYRQCLNGHAPVEQTKSALLGLAHMHRKQGYLTKAAAIYERYLKDYPNDDRVPDALLELGRTLRDMGAPKMAISRFYNVINSTLKLSTSSGFEHYQLLAKTAQFEVAETHFQSGDFVEATKFFSRLRMLDLAPADRARAHFKSAYSLQLAGDLEGAVTVLRAYLEQWPDDENVPEARYLLATSLRSLKRTQEALSATIDLLTMQKARTASDPKRWTYWQRRTGNQLANDFFQAGDIINALQIYQGLAALSDQPGWRIPVTYQIALCYERLSDLDRACQTYRAIVEAAGPSPAPEIADTARMATSRLAHVDWHDATDRQVATLFDSATGRLNPVPAKTTPSHDSDRSPAPASPAL